MKVKYSGYVIIMPNSPYDDFLKNLARMVEDIIKNMPQQDEPRFIGCTIITGDPAETPHVIRIDTARFQELEYEMIESDDRVFITARIPPSITSAVYADIQPDRIAIIAEERRTEIEPPCRIDILESFYQVNNGVIDIVLKKGRREAIPR
jgi:hypothetical protein